MLSLTSPQLWLGGLATVSQLALHNTVCDAAVGVGVDWSAGACAGAAPTLLPRLEKPRKIPASVQTPTRTAARLRTLFRRRIDYPLFLFSPGRITASRPVLKSVITGEFGSGGDRRTFQRVYGSGVTQNKQRIHTARAVLVSQTLARRQKRQARRSRMGPRHSACVAAVTGEPWWLPVTASHLD